MSTFLQVLRLAFWTNPLQRVLTCMGIVCVVVSSIAALSGSFASIAPHATPTWNALLEAFIIATIAILLMGGVYWRIASAPRIVQLAPHGRARLLSSVLGLVLLVALLWVVEYWLYQWHWVYPGFHLSLTARLADMGDAALLSSVGVVGLFIASRSPFAALAVLILLVIPGVALKLLDVNLLRHMNPGPRALMQLPLIWIPFSIWYLRARRISPPGWLSSGGQDVLATTLVSSSAPKSRGEALQRQLLGGTTVIRFGAQWFVILGLLLGLQWLLFTVGESSEPAVVARVMYASFCICPVVTTIVSFAAIRRSRSLWLLTASTRGEFFACVEGILKRLNIVMVLAASIWIAVLWFMQSRPPGFGRHQVAVAEFYLLGLSSLGWFAIYAQLAGWSRWPVAIVAAGALFTIWGGNSGVIVMVGASIASIALRWYAQRRWREGDFPRAVTSTASGT